MDSVMRVTRRYWKPDRDPDRDSRTVNVNDTERWVSAVGGGALVLYGLTRRSLPGLALALAGGGLFYRGATGHCYTYSALGVTTLKENQGHSRVASVPHKKGIRVEKAVTINRAPEELYRFWRNFENLPRFMNHLESVRVLDGDGKRSHWKAKAPLGTSVEWDAEIINEVENRLIGWRSLEGADVPNAGSVRFEPATGGRGTVVKVNLEYDPPAGVVGAAFAKLFGEEPTAQVQEDLRHFKQVMEAGEMPTTEGQPSGREDDRSAGQGGQPQQNLDIVQPAPPASTGPLDVVQEASEESFPASDPPAYVQETPAPANQPRR